MSADTLLAYVAALRPSDLGATRLRDARARLVAALARGREAGARTPDAAWRACADSETDDPVPGARTGLVAPYLGLRDGDARITLDTAATACAVCDDVAHALARGLRGHAAPERARALALVGAAAAAGAWLRGVDAATLSRCVAGALRACPPGLEDAVALAAAAAAALDAPPAAEGADPVLARLAPGAAARMATTLEASRAAPWFRTHPGPLAGGTALEAVAVILQRHLRAADKRLRTDQVERIDVHLAWPAWAELRRGDALRLRVGRLVAAHALDAGGRHGADDVPGADAVAARVVLHHDWRLSARLRPAPGDVRAALSALRHTGAVPPLRASDVRGWLAAAAPTRRGGVAGGAAPPPAPSPWTNPARVELWTTRGGRWPVRLDAPSLPDAVNAARARHPDADRLLAAPGDTDARAWAQAVLA